MAQRPGNAGVHTGTARREARETACCGPRRSAGTAWSPHRENWAGLRPASRGSAKPAPMTLRHANVSAAPLPTPDDATAHRSPAQGRAIFIPGGVCRWTDHAGFSRWGPAQRLAGPRAVPRRPLSRGRAPGPQHCERCLPLQCTHHAERRDSRREEATSELAVLPAARLRRAVPTWRSAQFSRWGLPCGRNHLHRRRSASQPFHARRGVQADRSWRFLPVGAPSRPRRRAAASRPRDRALPAAASMRNAL